MRKSSTSDIGNRRISRILKTAVFAAVLFMLGVLIFSMTAFYVMPLGYVERWAAGRLRDSTGLSVAGRSLERLFPFGIEARGVSLTRPGGQALVNFDRMAVRLRPMGLLLARVVLPVEGTIDGGRVDGVVTFRRGLATVRLMIEEAGFMEIPALRGKVEINGVFGGDVSLALAEGACPEGFVRLEGSGGADGRIRLMGVPLPVGGVDRAGLEADLSGCEARVSRLWLEGGDMSVMIRGVVFMESPLQQSRLEMTAEVVLGAALREKDYVTRFLGPYKKSANSYSIPVSGTVQSPRIGR